MQNSTLEAIAHGVEFEHIADMLCRKAEAISKDSVCTVVAIEPDGRLRSVAAPSLPEAYCDAIDTLYVGPEVGSCGTAAHFGTPVQVTDIATDPLWAPYKELALPLGLRACWSMPIVRSDGTVAATFAFYSRQSRPATEVERAVAFTCMHLCKVSIAYGEMLKRNFDLSHFDQLTGLPNRRRFEETFAALIAGDAVFGLLILDADHLKRVNDTFGHAIGDGLIAEISRRLAAIHKDATAYRIGGDEFAMIVGHCRDDDAVKRIAGQILDAMALPFETHGHSLLPSVSIGGVVHGPDEHAPSHSRQNADLALYHAKETARGSFVLFEPSLRTSMMRRMETIHSVREALEDGRIFNHYQPVVRIDSGKIGGLEVLMRMRAVDGTVVPAGEFLEALSDRRLAVALARRVADQAAKDMASWLAAGIAPEFIAINISGADFSESGIDRQMAAIFEAHGVPLESVTLEITETVVVEGDASGIGRAIKSLHNQGFTIALDDFGTGYASLTHLLMLPVDVIKIDKSFIARLSACGAGEAIVEALIGIADKIGLRVIAEGIECELQARCLIQRGCEYGQGYYFAPPADAERTTRILHSWSPKRIASAQVAAPAA
ncbi:EAL domain-containing protein [Jiella avicenniae]|uniref:EAL domain-containing protein n=1 Tax=Jiella avicenniae TaxID=2907202 RepID=A0A9X1NZB2_9HYPH|nr:EAL domain-containing protein [Jiella avicenniae]MCE7027029.1 EAL domain-containing protein [Jiella avicenniae]